MGECTRGAGVVEDVEAIGAEEATEGANVMEKVVRSTLRNMLLLLLQQTTHNSMTWPPWQHPYQQIQNKPACKLHTHMHSQLLLLFKNIWRECIHFKSLIHQEHVVMTV